MSKTNAMTTEIKLPELGENIETAEVLSVLVSAGQTVEKDQALIELETDKATAEVPSDLAGVVMEVLVKEGEETLVVKPADFQEFGVTERGIYFVNRVEASSETIEFFDFDTRKVKRIWEPEAPIHQSFGVGVSTDGQWILYTQVDQAGSDIMLVENFR